MQQLSPASGEFEVESSGCRSLSLLTFLKRHPPVGEAVRPKCETIRELKRSLDDRLVAFSRAGGLLKDLASSITRCVERQRTLLSFSEQGVVSASEESLSAMHEALTVAALLQARLGLSRDCPENLDIIQRETRLDVAWPPAKRDHLASPNRSHWMAAISNLNIPWSSTSHESLLASKLDKECNKLELELWECVRMHYHAIPFLTTTNTMIPKSSPIVDTTAGMTPIAAVAWSNHTLDNDTYRELKDIHGDLIALQEIQREFATHVDRSGEKLGAVEELTGEARAQTQKTQGELVKAAKQKSKGWTFEGGALGCTVGAVVGLLAGPPGAVLGLAAGGAMGSAAGRALKVRHRNQLRGIEERASEVCVAGGDRRVGGVLLSSGAVPVSLPLPTSK